MYPSIIYHIFPDRFFRIGNKNENLSDWDSGKPKYNNYFGGNLKGIISKIDYLSSFGIETLYLNPIFEASSNHRYDTKNYYKIDPLLGSMQDFNFLLSSLHKKGISLFLDGVFNHCGTQFFAFEDVLKKQDKSFYKDWFIIRKFPLKIGKGYYKSWKDHFKLVEFNFKNTILKNYLLKVAEFWASKGIDGWRLDAPERIPFSFWKDFSRKMKSINKIST
jgi:glycosidase